MAVPAELDGDDEHVDRAWLNQLREAVETLEADIGNIGPADELKASSSEVLKIETATGVTITLVAGGLAAGGSGPPGFYVRQGDHDSIDTTEAGQNFDYWLPFTDKRNAPTT